MHYAAWQIKSPADLSPELLALAGGHPVVARLLAQRGFENVERARAFLDPQHYQPSPPDELTDMSRAVALIRETIARRGHIRIWGDFDTDGQTATALLWDALQALHAQVDYRLPLRLEGHGFSAEVAQQAQRDGVALLITCDTGSGDAEAVAATRAAGIPVIVTDHHDLAAEPLGADAFLNPKRLPPGHPLRELSGVGVAYLLASALLTGSQAETRLPELLDLVALGLIGDLATQVNEVRYLCQLGLAALRATERPGLRALLALAHLDQSYLDEDDVGYQLAPRLNAAGRLADAHEAVELLTTRDASRAQELARRLEALNLERRALTEATYQQVERRLQADPDLLRQPALIVESEDWVPGILGLVAGDLARRYGRPVILITYRAEAPCVASARSIEGVDIHRAIAAQADLLLREGGHPMAAGFAIASENLPAFRERLLAHLRKVVEVRPGPVLEIDAIVPARELTLDLARALARLAPHGPGNPRPTLLLEEANLLRVEDVSRNQETAHRRLYLRSAAEDPLRVLWFNAGELPMPDEPIEVALQVGLDHWQGRERLQLVLLDWRPRQAVIAPKPALLAGRELVDWRARTDREVLCDRLRATYGEAIVFWGEGAEGLPVGTATRADLPTEPRPALAILTAPAGPEVLRLLLDRLRPGVLYLLPLLPVDDAAEALLRHIAGLVRGARERHQGWLEVSRMAARMGSREETVRVALLGLAAAGRLDLWEREGRWRVGPETEPSSSPAQRVIPPPAAQAREALAYLLRETAAYRRAFAQEPLETLLYV